MNLASRSEGIMSLHPESRKILPFATLLFLPLASLLSQAGAVDAQVETERRAKELIVGLPCEGCEAVFEGLPDSPGSAARLAPEGEPGEPMRVEGTVYDDPGSPALGVIVHAYQTDARGILSGRRPLGRLGTTSRSAARLGAHRRGRPLPVRYDSARQLPGSGDPSPHAHARDRAGRFTYYVDSIHFTDDPMLSEEERAEMAEGRGGGGLVDPSRDADGTWVVNRDIVLGLNVPGYHRCDE